MCAYKDSEDGSDNEMMVADDTFDIENLTPRPRKDIYGIMARNQIKHN
jgi:hypothetical protein